VGNLDAIYIFYTPKSWKEGFMDINVKQQHINITSLKEAQIHLISEIQPHGILLVLQEPDLQILQISENTFNTFGISPEDMVQEELEDLLDPYQIQKIKFWLSEENLDFINSVA
jgi:chemotaxis family two-component system sensor kinase Cph1